MRGPWLAALAVSIAGAAATIPPFWPGLGEPISHHNWSLAVTLVLFLMGAYVGRADARRHMALSVALWTTLAIVSGFLILYLKQDLKATGYKDWAKFWHIAWSWLALWAFAGHTWINRKPLMRSLRGLHARFTGAIGYSGVLVLILAAIPLTWSSWGADALQEPQYIPLTLWTWLAVLVGGYGAWLIFYVRRRGGRTPDALKRPAVQRFVDGWLLPMTILANISGFPLLYFGTKHTALKYVAKYWHTWPSIVMTVLVFAHTIQFLPGIVAHWRRRAGRVQS